MSARKSCTENRSVYDIHEDLSTGLMPQSRKKTVNRGALTVLCWVVITCVSIQKSYGADLWDIYQLALNSDPTYRAAVFSHQSARLNLPLAKTAFKPSLTINGKISRKQPDLSTATKTSDDNAISLNLNLLLYDKSKRLNITQSEHQVEISSLQLLDAKQQLMLRVANRYFNLLAAQDTREVARLEKIAIRRQRDLASERLQVGLGTQTDLFDARARFKLAKANEILAQNQINNGIAALKQIIGITPQALSGLSNSAPLELPTPNDVGAWIKHSVDHNIGVRMETLNLEIALQEINKQRTGKSPTINLSGNASSSGGGNNIASAALVVKFPLYLGGVINLKTQQAGLNYNRREHLLAQTRRSATTKTTSSFLAVTSGVSRVEALFDAITAGESALQAKAEGFAAGLTTNLDVLDAQRELSRSRTEYLRARYDYIIAVLELEGSVSQLDETVLKRVNGWLTR